MKLLAPIIVITIFCGLAFGQSNSDATHKLALPEHNGQFKWTANGFKIVQSSAKANGREIGLRGQDSSGRLSFLAFLFLVPESAPLTSEKCRDGALNQEKKIRSSLRVLSTSEILRPDGPPISLVTFTSKAQDGALAYVVRGFVATEDICGDLEFNSRKPISAEDADLKEIFSTCELDAGYIPKFSDVFLYAQILYQTQMYKAAAPIFEKALPMVTNDGAPFPSLRIAKRVVIDQAGMSYGIAGELTKARAIFEKAIVEDPDYPMYYYNLACADAGEKKLADARLRLQQAFARKANLNPGETMPDPTKDDSFLPYKRDKAFWAFVESLHAGK